MSLSSIIIGLIAGWLAGLITKGRGFGLFGNLIIGVVGAFIGSQLIHLFGLSSYGFAASLATATLGALALLYLANLISKK